MNFILRVFCAVLSLLLVPAGIKSRTVTAEPAEPWLMLSARTSNWGQVCSGEWGGKSWSICSDGSYEMTVSYIQDRDFTWEPAVYTGTMTPEEFSRLRDACDCEWIDPEVNSDACDGQGWQILMFDPDGNVLRTSGEFGYIYGQKNVEAIIRLLPRPDLNPVYPRKADPEYFRTVTESTTYEEMIREIGPSDSISGSGIITYCWKLEDGSEAHVKFFDDRVMTLVIAMDGEMPEWIVR